MRDTVPDAKPKKAFPKQEKTVEQILGEEDAAFGQLQDVVKQSKKMVDQKG